MNQKIGYFLCLSGLLLIHSTILFAEKTPPDLFLTSKVEDNSFFATALKNKSDKSYFENIKIQYLIEAIRVSPLTFIRNNDPHEGKKAASHLSWKYLHALGKVKTPQDFIENIASQSTQTGQPYLVKNAGGETYPLKDVLYNELRRLEQALL